MDTDEITTISISPGVLGLAGNMLDAYEPLKISVGPNFVVFNQGDKKTDIKITSQETSAEPLKKCEWNVKATNELLDFIDLIPDDVWVWEQTLENIEESIDLLGNYCFGTSYEGMLFFECNLKRIDRDLVLTYLEYKRFYDEARSHIPEVDVTLYPDKIEFQYWVNPYDCLGAVVIELTEN